MQKKIPVIVQLVPAMQEGGVEKGISDFYPALLENNIKSIVISKGGRWVTPIMEHISLNIGSKNPIIFIKNYFVLKNIIKNIKPDIIEVHSRVPAWLGYLVAKKQKCHYLPVFHSAFGSQNKLKRAYNSVMLKNKTVVAISEFIKDHIIDVYKYDGKIVVINRCVDEALFNKNAISDESRVSLKNGLGIKNSTFTIGFVGRISRAKGVIDMVKAVAMLKNLDIKIIFAGTFKNVTFENEFKDLVEKEGLKDKVLLLGHRKDINLIFDISDISISAKPDTPEAFGRTVLESMAMGTPLIVSSLGEPKNLVKDNINGWHTKRGDIKELADKINYLYNHRDEVAKMASQAEKDAQKFTLKRMCDETIAFYKNEYPDLFE